MQVKAYKLEWPRRMLAEDRKQKYNFGLALLSETAVQKYHLQPCFFINSKELCQEPLVSQATPFIERKGLPKSLQKLGRSLQTRLTEFPNNNMSAVSL